MAKVTMLGTGLMGAGFAEALLKRGETVTVWNRTIERARPLEKLGARVVADLKEAVAGAERVHISLGDDATVDALLEHLAGALPKGAVVIDHTTVTPKGTLARYAWCEQRGIEFLHAPVFMSPQACRDAGGVMIASGPQARFDRVEADLKKMTGDLWYVGERNDKAAALKLFGNCLLFFVTAGLADVYGLAKAVDISAPDAHELFSHFNIAMSVKMRGGAMAQGNFDSSFDLGMARKDLRLMLETAAEGNVELAVLPAIGKRMDEFIHKGQAGADLGVIAADFVKPPLPV